MKEKLVYTLWWSKILTIHLLGLPVEINIHPVLW